MAKTEQALRDSRENHEKILLEYRGELPQSIMRHDKSDKAIDLMATERSYSSNLHLDTKIGDKHSFRVSGSGCFNGSLSRFPQNVGRALLLFYTKLGDTVVDPFAGHNSRMELCWRAGRNYIGQDLSHEFMAANRKIHKMLLAERENDLFPETCSNADITLYEGDSRRMKAATASGDFTITSPPYWNIEDYGDEVDQLGLLPYPEFLQRLGEIMRENYRCLKRGAFCVWCINDFRKGGKFYSYHEDCANLLRAAGFVQWDICITDLGSSMRACFPNQAIEQKILPKRHEYCLIFRKPELKILPPR